MNDASPRTFRAFEAATGVTVLIDDTPNAVVLSGFDPVRREIARESMQRLMQDPANKRPAFAPPFLKQLPLVDLSRVARGRWGEDEAADWYCQRLGWVVKTDEPFPGNPNNRWLTVAPPEQGDVEVGRVDQVVALAMAIEALVAGIAARLQQARIAPPLAQLQGEVVPQRLPEPWVVRKLAVPERGRQFDLRVRREAAAENGRRQLGHPGDLLEVRHRHETGRDRQVPARRIGSR